MEVIVRRGWRVTGLWLSVCLCLASLSGCGGQVCIEGVPCGPVPRYDENRPAPVVTTQRFIATGLGNWHSCMLDTTGAAWCWGFGAAGDGGAINDVRRIPVSVAGGLRFEQIASGQGRSCGLTAAGAAWCWGQGITGALGDGASLDRAGPVAVVGGLAYQSIGVGGMATCGIAGDGIDHCWGWNEVGAPGMRIVAH